jgi:hypothetical protein
MPPRQRKGRSRPASPAAPSLFARISRPHRGGVDQQGDDRHASSGRPTPAQRLPLSYGATWTDADQPHHGPAGGRDPGNAGAGLLPEVGAGRSQLARPPYLGTRARGRGRRSRRRSGEGACQWPKGIKRIMPCAERGISSTSVGERLAVERGQPAQGRTARSPARAGLPQPASRSPR